METRKIVKTKDLDPEKMMTKSYYAREEGISATSVNGRIDRGTVAVVIIKGVELIHL